MPVTKAPTNRKIIRNYVAMPDRPQFCAADVVAAVSLCHDTVAHELLRLSRLGVIVRLPKKIERCAYYRQPTDPELRAATATPVLNNESQEARVAALLSKMVKNVIYSSRTLREVAGWHVPFCILDALARDGRLDKLCRNNSYYWIKRS